MATFDLTELAPGRQIHHLVSGPVQGPAVLFDAGAFGIYADGWWVKEALKDRYRVILYDRASMGLSDPVPEGEVPTPAWHAGDMVRLLDALGVRQRVIVIGHSMAGLRLNSLANLYQDRLAGLIFVDALCPRQLKDPTGRPFGKMFEVLLASGVFAAQLKLTEAARLVVPNNFKLSGQPREDKIASYASLPHYRAAHREVDSVDYEAADLHGEGIYDLPCAFFDATPINGYREADAERALRQCGYGYYAKLPRDGHVSCLLGEAAEKIRAAVDGIVATGTA